MALDIILPIAFALAMDAFSVALATSVRLKRISRRQVFRFAFHFGLFQAMMPFIGWYAGQFVEDFIRSWAHWLALVLLVGVGLRTIAEAFGRDGSEEMDPRDPTRGWSLVVLSVATSIDALAVGFSFALLQLNVGVACLVIGVVTAALTFVGMVFGSRLGNHFGKPIEVLGGVILIAMGLNIVLSNG